MKIQLDTKALNALFPEGSEARVELQKAVITNFISRNFNLQVDEAVLAEIKEIESTLHSKIKNQTHMAIRQSLEKNFKVKWSGEVTSLSEHLKDKIKSQVEAAWSNQIELDITKQIREFDIKGYINQRMIRIDGWIERLLKDKESEIQVKIDNMVENLKVKLFDLFGTKNDSSS